MLQEWENRGDEQKKKDRQHYDQIELIKFQTYETLSNKGISGDRRACGDVYSFLTVTQDGHMHLRHRFKNHRGPLQENYENFREQQSAPPPRLQFIKKNIIHSERRSTEWRRLSCTTAPN